MKLIETGTYLMGSEDWGEFESPVHEVTIDAFLMDETPVTNMQFAEFVMSTGFKTDAEKAGAAWNYKDGKYQMVAGLSWRSFAVEQRINHPVVLVSWNDAKAFASWAGKRLPTEAEWEYAARGGIQQALYPWGDEFIGDECNWNQAASEIPATTSVGTYKPNHFGLVDMVGNVWQWMNDSYEEHYYMKSPDNNPHGPMASTGLKVRRGASFNVIQPFRLRCANRGAYQGDTFSVNIGFRCAKSTNSNIESLAVKEVELALDKVREAMEADGGGISLRYVDELTGNVYLKFKGACINCPSQSLTMRYGISKVLRDHVQWLKEIHIIK